MLNLKKNRTIVIVLVLVTSISFCGTKITIKAIEESNTDLPSNLAGTTLTIVTRHDVIIINEFKSEFLSSDYAINRNVTDIDFLSASTDEGWKKLLEDPSKSVDLAWGGDPGLLSTMESYGLLKHIDNSTLKAIIDSSIPEEIAGTQMKEEDSSGDYIWVGNAISSYGFTVNHDFLNDHGLPVPSTWEELASPVYYLGPSVKAISMSDPPLSSSNTKIYQIILQAFDWEAGWSILTRMGGNAGMYPGSVDTRAAVVSGDVGIGMTIDFYGIIAQRENPNCEYIIPEGQSIISPDPIALGINVDDQVGAEAFIEFLISPEGQNVWMHEGLDRLPVSEEAFQTPYGQTRLDLYALYNDTIVNVGVSFDEIRAKQTQAITMYYFYNTITVLHEKLRTTWGEMVNHLELGFINSSYFSKLVDDLGIPYLNEAEAILANEEFLNSASIAAEMESLWRIFAKNKYDDIFYDLMGMDDDSYEDNDFIFEAAILPDEGIFVLFYRDIDIFNITLEKGYSYFFSIEFNSEVIDLDLFLLPPNFDGNEENILARSEGLTSPEDFEFSPDNTDTYILLITYYDVEEEPDAFTSYTLKIIKESNDGNGIETPTDGTKTIPFPVIILPLIFLAVSIIFIRRR